MEPRFSRDQGRPDKRPRTLLRAALFQNARLVACDRERTTTGRGKGNGVNAPTTIFTLNNGVEMPALGLGVFQTPPHETLDAVRAALGAGYRHIDTAAAYGNERQVGEAAHRSDLDRSDVFLETKIWISDYGYNETLHGFEKSAGKLGVDQIGRASCRESVDLGGRRIIKKKKKKRRHNIKKITYTEKKHRQTVIAEKLNV